MVTAADRRLSLSGRRRGAAAAALGVIALVAMAITTAAAGPVPVLPVDTGSPIGDQPHVPVAPCSFPRLGAREIRVVYSQWSPGHGPQPNLSSGDTVDPWKPCHILQVLQWVQPTRVVRSDDNGHDFATVFTAPSPGDDPLAGLSPAGQDVTIPSPQMTVTPVLVPAPGQDYLIDTGAEYGVVHSGDGGVHWEQRNRGLPLLTGRGSTLVTAAFAASNPQVGYVVVMTPGVQGTTFTQTLLFRTADGGGSWSLVPAHVTTIQDVAVDPDDPDHVVVTDRQSAAVWESSDSGMTWSSHALPPNQAPTSLLVTHPAELGAGHVRLYVKCTDAQSAVIGWMRSFDDGQTWQVLPTPPPEGGTDAALAADPQDADRMVLAAQPYSDARSSDPNTVGPLTLYSSEDGFATVTSSAPLAVSWSWSTQRPYIFHVDQLRLMADHTHDFFLQVMAPAYSEMDHGRVLPPSPVGDHLFAFRLDAITPSPPPPPPPSGVAPGVGNPQTEPGTTVPIQPSAAMSQCQLPTTVNAVSWAPSQQWGGSLTYDGRYLDYTFDNTPSSTAGLIDRVDPVTCRPAPPLRVALPGDPTNGGAPPILHQLTYDPRYVFHNGHHGAILPLAVWVNDHRGGRLPFPIYAVDPLTGATELALSILPDYGPQGGACSSLTPSESPTTDCYAFTYDVSRDALWVMIDGNPALVPLPAVHGGVAMPVSTCMTTHYPFGAPGYYATLLAVAHGVMYAQLEDNATVLRGDDQSCTLLGGFRHPQFAEPGSEDEQIACDALTDGEGSAYVAGGGAPTTLIWVRDSIASTAQSYEVPDGFCPFATLLAVQPTPTVLAGSGVSLCAMLERASADGIPIAGQTVALSVDGRAAGSARTDGRGRACLTTVAPLSVGAHRVHADFAGTHVSFLPSSADGALSTYALAAHAGSGPAAPLLVAETPPLPLPQPVPQSQIAGQAQIDAQMQAQANPQTLTQMQPGVMAQRQRQGQVVTELLPTRLSQPAYQATALRPSRRTVPAAMVASVLLFGLGLVVRRRAPALARARRE